MDVSLLDAAGQALVTILDPYRLMMLSIAVVAGLVIGILPGIGGLSGMALLLPFTYGMDPYTALAFLLGLAAVTSTGDTIPAVLFGVPGTSGAQATVLDGLPLAQKGQAGRALAAAYTASLLGGLFGAFLLAVTIPVLRPVMLMAGSPELLALAIFGISMVAVLSGSTPLRGLAMGALGVMLAMIGSDPQTGTQRWTFGNFYLWDGLPLLPVVLGLFALPELADLAIRRISIARTATHDIREGMFQGARDTLRNWWLVLRCGGLGALLGAIPGLGGQVVDWMAYGHALRSEKDANLTFGRGDIRGVIAPESANNAKEGGALLPTIAFGVPGTASMALLLGAFLMHGLVPGPDMLNTHLDVTYAMVLSIAVANILGAGLCFAFSGQFARIATLRYTLILPGILAIMYVGAFNASRQWGDLYTLVLFGIIGWTMKRLKWPRPPLILGFVLGAIIERYLFVSTAVYGAAWLLRPAVVVILIFAALGLMRPLLQDIRYHGGPVAMLRRFGAPRLTVQVGFYLLIIAVLVGMLYMASDWRRAARLVPEYVGYFALAVCVLSLFNEMFHRRSATPDSQTDQPRSKDAKIHMDMQTDMSQVGTRLVALRAVVFLGWLLGVMASMALIGLLPTMFVFVIAFMRVEGREPWRLVLPMAMGLTLFIYVMFDRLLSIPWPATWIGGLFPVLRVIPTV